jgi:hypothetical protein
MFWHLVAMLPCVLCLQAHYNAQTHSDEFVLELLLSLDKLSLLVQELLVIEVGTWSWA